MKRIYTIFGVILLSVALTVALSALTEDDKLFIGRRVVVDGDTITVTARKNSRDFYMSNRTVMDIRLVQELLIEEEK